MMFRRFSERIGIAEPRVDIQLNSMSQELRHKLWNCFFLCVWQKRITHTTSYERSNIREIFVPLWHKFYKSPIDLISPIDSYNLAEVRTNFFNSDWFGAYDFLDFIANMSQDVFNKDDFILACNAVLEEELSAYRFVEGKMVNMTSPTEIASIEEAIANTKKYGSDGAHAHLKSALRIFSNKQNPDYPNVIKESINAVESLANGIAQQKEGTSLHKALKILADKTTINETLMSGLNAIYSWTSSDGGIRHGMLDKSNVNVEDAKYMFVACTAFVNYIIAKCVKGKIPLK